MIWERVGGMAGGWGQVGFDSKNEGIIPSRSLGDGDAQFAANGFSRELLNLVMTGNGLNFARGRIFPDGMATPLPFEGATV